MGGFPGRLELSVPAADVKINREALALAIDYHQPVEGSRVSTNQVLVLYSPAGQSADLKLLGNIQGVPGLLGAGTVVLVADGAGKSAQHEIVVFLRDFVPLPLGDKQ